MAIVIFVIAYIIGLIIQYFIKKSGTRQAVKTYHSDFTEIDYMDGHDFEYFCASLLRKNGFTDVRVTPASGDQGVDIIANRDGYKFAIQCKRYNSPLSNKPVQEVYAGKAIYGCSKAIVLTNNYFTQGAINAANATGVILWDRDKLNSLMGENFTYSVPVSQNQRTYDEKPSKSRDVPGILFKSLLAVVAVLIGIGLSSNDHPKNESNNLSSTISTSTPVEASEKSFENNKLSFSVTNMMFARHYGNLKYMDLIDSSLINCVVYVTVENNSSSEASLTDFSPMLICAGKKYQQSLWEDDEFLFSYKTVPPNSSIISKAVNFQIPKEQQNSTSAIQFIISSGDNEFSWQLR